MSERTLFFLQADEVGVYDASFHAKALRASPKVKVDGRSGAIRFTEGAHIEIPRDEQYEKLQAFTITANVRLTDSSNRQTLVEGQSPPISLRVERGGKLLGSVHTPRGWRSVTSGNTGVPVGTDVQIVFTRDAEGNMRLEVDGEEVGKRKVTGKLTNVGEKGILLGVAADQQSDQFKGRMVSFSISSGVLDPGIQAQRNALALELQGKIKQTLNLDKIRVVPDRDESYARLQPIKSILSAVGVDDLTDLAILTVPDGTVITPGKILIAPHKTAGSVVDIEWGQVALDLRAANASEERTLLAKFLPNRNSGATIRKAIGDAGSSRTTAPRPIGGVPAAATRGTRVLGNLISGSPLLRATSVARSTTGHAIDRANAVLASTRIASTTSLSQVVDLSAAGLQIRDAALADNLDSDKPHQWPLVGGAQVFLTSTFVLPVDTSVIIADTVDLRDVQLRIEPEVAKLYLIAESILVNANSSITWRRPGGSTAPRADDADLNGRGYSGQHLKPNSYDGLDGEDGSNGGGGLPGASGRTAPALEIWVRSMNGMPNLDLNGENGIRGGRGQRGGRGGNGASGRVGKRTWFFGWHCTKDPGDGGDGGGGGDGGRGGRGGSGGDGSDITVGVLEGTLETTVTANVFRIKNQGGQRGKGGEGGPGGLGGRGGRSGVGETCKDAENGHHGSQGQPGRMGDDGASLGGDGYLDFFEFDEDAWDELFTRPWLTEIYPEYVFPGDNLTLTGSRFTSTDRVHIGTHVLAPTINADESISVLMPPNVDGGEKSVFVRRPDGSESNRLRLWVKPQLNPFSEVISPGSTVNLTGRAFLSGASVLLDGESVASNVASATSLSFEVPGTGGAGSSERNVQLQVHNPDGMLSNIRSATIPQILEIPFRFPDHALNFDNFKSGSPSWGTYEDTYGAAEIYHELLDPIFGHPVLTAAFYAFYHYFLLGEDNGGLATGFCTSMTARVLDELWTGSTDTFTRVNLNANTRRDLTAIHGRLLSRESLIHFHDQGRQGVSRVTQTYREIEQTFFNGCDRHNAPMLFFIPAGAVWNEGYFDSLGDSHCIAPIRFVYPEGHPGPAPDGSTDPDGVTLFCWDCNHPPSEDTGAIESENCRLEFKRIDGQIHFEYKDGGSGVKFSSEDGVTLGMMTNGKYFLSDHDLPFSGPFGLTRFVLDFLLSPADLQVSDENGLRTGKFGTQILAEIPDSHPCYLVQGAYLLPPDTALERRIAGQGIATYDYHSIAPDGTSISLEGVSTNPGEVDHLSINADGSQVRITPGSGKDFSLQLAKELNDEIRTVSISGVGGGPSEEVDLTLSPDLSVVRVGNRSAARTVDVTAFAVNKNTRSHATSNRGGVNLPQDHDLILTVSDWADLDLDVATLHF